MSAGVAVASNVSVVLAREFVNEFRYSESY
jgi:hypothetical protein